MVYSVEKIFIGETDVWMTEAVVDEIFDHDGIASENMDLNNIPAGLFKKIDYFSKAGFRNHEGKRGQPIKYEGEGVYRIGVSDLFRVYGFYEDEARKIDFIAITTWSKHGQKNTQRERDIISHVAEVKKNGSWTKNT